MQVGTWTSVVCNSYQSIESAEGENGVDAGPGHLTVVDGKGDIDIVAGRLML